LTWTKDTRALRCEKFEPPHVQRGSAHLPPSASCKTAGEARTGECSLPTFVGGDWGDVFDPRRKPIEKSEDEAACRLGALLVKFKREYVEKPWGRPSLPPMFDPPPGKRIGEVWFTGGKDLPLLAKYIFTSEKLSIQVHPSDDQARLRGLRSGKAECWYIIEAAPDAVLGLGLTREVTGEELRSAALDGSIEPLMHWQPVHAGDFIFVPPGTIHAIGEGIALLEFQQNADITYRLYDYGRPRELHLDDGVAVAAKGPFDDSLIREVKFGESQSLVDARPFKLVSGTHDAFTKEDRWIMPLSGQVRSRNDVAQAGDVLFAQGGEPVRYEEAWALTGVSA
jgi:mannose-6-phosphate isomerase